MGARTDLRCERLELGGIARGERHAEVCTGERPRHGSAQPVAGADDQDASIGRDHASLSSSLLT
jgi:hypothetical protein